MSKHSPGPWKIQTDLKTGWGLLGADGKDVLFLYTSDGAEPSDVDARLMMSAPEMLNLLRQCLTEDHGDHRPTCSPAGECFHDQIRALLARIDGQDVAP